MPTIWEIKPLSLDTTVNNKSTVSDDKDLETVLTFLFYILFYFKFDIIFIVFYVILFRSVPLAGTVSGAKQIHFVIVIITKMSCAVTVSHYLNLNYSNLFSNTNT